MALADTTVGTLLLSLSVLAQPVVGMILMDRGKRRLGKALVLSIPWTVVACAVGVVALLAWLIHTGGLFGQSLLYSAGTSSRGCQPLGAEAIRRQNPATQPNYSPSSTQIQLRERPARVSRHCAGVQIF